MSNQENSIKLQKLCNENPDLKELIDSYESDYKLLLSRFTHEIRNPLTLIYSTLQLMDKKYPELKELSYFPQIMGDMKDVFQLLDELSTFNHSYDLTLKSINLVDLLTDLKVSFEPLAREKDCTIFLKLLNTSHSHVKEYEADYIKLKQAFVNLIKNAIEAAAKQSQIQIILNASKEISKDYFSIQISNVGTSIDSSMLSTIFVPFVTTKATGSGLGLPVANKIITRHGGYINVTSTSELTTFEVFLPFQHENTKTLKTDSL